jgi:hypothetical protein
MESSMAKIVTFPRKLNAARSLEDSLAYYTPEPSRPIPAERVLTPLEQMYEYYSAA